MRTPHVLRVFLLAAAATLVAACGGEPPRIRLATTTSVQDSGLLAAILPEFEAESGIRVDVIAVGTGEAFKRARDGNADLLLVHDRKGEDEFVASGHGTSRHDLMWNTFEVLGPKSDPAGVASAKSAEEAFRRIAAAKAPFLSRGDDSGTHRREKSLWTKSGVKPEAPWHQETGQGMGPTLRIADEKDAYVLADQGTRLGYKGSLRLVPHLGGTADLKNHYAVVRISAAKHPDIDAERAEVLATWFLSPATAKRIEAFRVGGQALFHPASATVPGER